MPPSRSGQLAPSISARPSAPSAGAPGHASGKRPGGRHKARCLERNTWPNQPPAQSHGRPSECRAVHGIEPVNHLAQVRDQYTSLCCARTCANRDMNKQRPKRSAGITMQTISAIQPLKPRQGASKPPAIERVTGKVRAAIEAMVWQALPRGQAAKAAGISEHGLYKALRKPPVRALYLSEIEVLRTSERARNIHALAEVRDQTVNQAARVAAVNALERHDDSHQSASRGQVAGFIIQVVNMMAGSASAANVLIDQHKDNMNVIKSQDG